MKGPIARILGLILLPLLVWGARPLTAQLRPYEPIDWTIFDSDTRATGKLGLTRLFEQRAALTGTQGDLLEAGRFQLFWRTGRVALESSGVVRRSFSEKGRFAEPMPFVHPSDGGSRSDFGDFTLSTSIRITPESRRALGMLRFGTRLPTTDNEIGLERDATDFFALLGGRLDVGPLRSAAEVGVGINGTRDSGSEQSDVFVYLLSMGLPGSFLQPALLLVGHVDGRRDGPIRGSEELSEVRLRLRSRGRLWLEVEAIRGLTAYSPDAGLSLALGARF
jgi:hypothetical protein